MIDFAADAAAIAADTKGFGVEVTYVPRRGSVMTVRIIPSRPDETTRFGGASVVSAAATFLVPVATVAAPGEGDKIRWGDTTYLVQGEPVRDPRHLWWTVEARPA